MYGSTCMQSLSSESETHREVEADNTYIERQEQFDGVFCTHSASSVSVAMYHTRQRPISLPYSLEVATLKRNTLGSFLQPGAVTSGVAEYYEITKLAS